MRGSRSLSKKFLGLLRAEALNRLIPAPAIHSPERIAHLWAVALCILLAVPPSGTSKMRLSWRKRSFRQS